MDPELKKLLDAIAAKQQEITAALEAGKTEIKEFGAASADTKQHIADLVKARDELRESLKAEQKAREDMLKVMEKVNADVKAAQDRMTVIETQKNRPGFGGQPQAKSLGEQFVESDQYKAMVASGGRNCNPVQVKSITGPLIQQKTMTEGDATSGAALVGPPMYVPQPILEAMRKPTLRGILGTRTTGTDAVYYAQETGFAALATTLTATANKAAQSLSVLNVNGFYAGQSIYVGTLTEAYVVDTITADANPAVGTATGTITITEGLSAQVLSGGKVTAKDFKPTPETYLKPFANIQFTALIAYVKTIATMIPVSNQLIADSASLSAVINTKLPYALLLAEEAQILYGDEANDNAQLPGIMNNASVQTYLWSSGAEGDTMLDAIRHGINLAELQPFPVDFVLVHPTDFTTIETAKDTTGQYIAKEIVKTNPDGSQTIWGKKLIRTLAVLQGKCLIGATLGAEVVDREMANIKIFDQYLDFPAKNMSLIRAEERIALGVGRPEAFVAVTFDAAPTPSS